MQQRRPATRRRTAAVIVTAALAALVGTTVSVVPDAAPAAAATREVESPDFASEIYGDPWNYSNTADQNTDSVGTPTSVKAGKLQVALRSGDAVSLVDTISGSLPYGRDGAAKPVDASRYKRLSFKMDQPFDRQIGAVWWWTCREKTSECGGGITFPVTPGNKVYDLSLASSTLQSKRAWSGKIVALRLDPVVLPAGKTGTARIDWTRLHGTGGAHAAYPAGTYGTTTVVRRPRPVVDSPNVRQGVDLATRQRGKPWVFTTADNASGVGVKYATVLGYGGRGMTARNSGQYPGDSQLTLPVSKFAADTYHNLSVEYSYDGSFSLAGTPGGGKMARLIWWDQSSTVPQIGNDMLTWSGVNAKRIDIDLSAQNDLDEDALAPELGWNGRSITQLRYDPNEDPGALTWHLKAIHLRADPSSTGPTTVTFHDAAWEPGATAAVSVARKGTGDWHTIAKDIAVKDGTNSVRFALGSLPQAKYRVRVAITHPGVSTVRAVSSAVVMMRR
ncbi:hypothetical protein DEJ34_06270 [Curtobacterium sp. MCPF17_050]|uniref:hypothetical protein n=1 Tax=Curtobacterium sp. MCPF17_050 TaxID=2175664 RepID=UPI000D83D4A6|nr:hypothetical protein [Curtobacterium sp. MCPF17_050]WIB16733.1 hypothetical protein DEJ34_06270 [Curtobacterium sp. MCPF17_050]